MKDRVEKIRNDIVTKTHNHSDELVIVGLRIVELLEQLLEKEAVDARRGNTESEPKPKREYKRNPRKPKPKPGFRRAKRIVEGFVASGTEDGKES